MNVLYADNLRQIFRYLPYYACVLRAVCKSWRDIYPYHRLSDHHRVLWHICHSENIVSIAACQKLISRLDASLKGSFHRMYCGNGITNDFVYTRVMLKNGHCNHLISENPFFITPTVSGYWVNLILSDSREVDRSLILRYTNNSAYGAAWLMINCCLLGRVDLALAILQGIKVTDTSTQFISRFANFTPIIISIHNRIGLQQDILIKLGAIHNNIELLEYVVGKCPTDGQIYMILHQSRAFGHYKIICKWLQIKCMHDASLMSDLMEITHDICMVHGASSGL